MKHIVNVHSFGLGFLLLIAAYGTHAEKTSVVPLAKFQKILTSCPAQVESALEKTVIPGVALATQQQQVCGCLAQALTEQTALEQADDQKIFSVASEKFTQCLAPELGKQFTYNCSRNEEWIANAPARGFNLTQFKQFCQCMGSEFIPAMIREPNMPDFKSNQMTESCVRQAKTYSLKP